MLVMVIDPQTGAVELANAGHPPPLVGSGDAFAPLAIEPQLVLAIDKDDRLRDSVRLSSRRLQLASLHRRRHRRAIARRRAARHRGAANSLVRSFNSAQSLLDTVLETIESFRLGREICRRPDARRRPVCPCDQRSKPTSAARAPVQLLDSPFRRDRVCQPATPGP